MNILITGSSGLIGTDLKNRLKLDGHNILALQRNRLQNNTNFWLPSENIIQIDESKKIDAVINLAGESIAQGRWNSKKKDAILTSRVTTTKLISKTISEFTTKPEVFISASAIGYYGNTGDEFVDEESSQGSEFLSDVCSKWEEATKPASEAGIRTAQIRIGLVLSPLGGALPKMIIPFKMGLGGIIGNGKQYISWISINELINIICYIINQKNISGPVNLVSQNPVSNYEFTKTLGKVLKRPTFLPLPSLMAKIMFGQMADELLLSSKRVLPAKLKQSGYTFNDQNLEMTLQSILIKNQ
jgi:uncharacterized protein (TIGR01777 family)